MPRLNGIRNGKEHEVGHELDRVTRRPVLAGLLVVLFVELPHQLLEHRAHGVVVHGGVFHRAIAIENGIGAQVDLRIEELLDQGAEGVRFRERGDLVAELEVLENILDVRRKAVEVSLEVGLSCCWLARFFRSRSVNFEVL